MFSVAQYTGSALALELLLGFVVDCLLLDTVRQWVSINLCISQATRAGDQLLLESAGCPLCSSETGGQGAAAAELLLMVDIGRERGI